MSGEELHFAFTGSFQFNNNEINSGEFSAKVLNDKLVVADDAGNEIESETFLFAPNSFNSFFELKNVTIGVDFHWEQKENQRFRGDLNLS